jgi:Reverse transcriptase (RNA-dependent DNA polymerase)
MDFTRKARFVAGGHKMDPPSSITYASVVSRERVRIDFLLAVLNDLDVMAADIQGAYLKAPCCEKVYTVCGAEFGEHAGKMWVIKLALYALKSSRFALQSHLAETLCSLDFSMCYADNDVWFKPATKLDGTEFYEYVLVYTDDILAISTKPGDILAYLDQHYVLKPNLIGPPLSI